MKNIRTAEYSFPLPEEAIAYEPQEKRDGSRLMILHRDGHIEHRSFHELPLYLKKNDLLLLNDSKVFPARLTGRRDDGSECEILLVSEISEGLWNIMMRGRYSGEVITADGTAVLISNGKTASFPKDIDIRKFLWEHGSMPLPPYIRRHADERDKIRYQTVYAKAEGSIAAPTAGLHFTRELLDTIAAKGVAIRFLTLHVGTGTFRPVKAEKVSDHRMDPEFFEMNASLIDEIGETKKSGGRIIAVGTTATRTIEGFLSGNASVLSGNSKIKGSTDIFIGEGYSFRAVDTLITNFHLPCSTPLMLASGLAGRENLLKSYRVALSEGYRFFSYGDAMLVL